MRKKIEDTKIISFIMLMIFIGAFFLASVVFNLFFTDLINGEENSQYQDATQVIGRNVKGDKIKDYNQGKVLDVKSLMCIQCGVYRDYYNAEKRYEDLKSYGIPFMVRDGEYYKVIFGIYPEELGNKIIEVLDEKDIEVAEFNISTEILNKDDAVEYEIRTGLLKVIWKMANNGLAGISLESYKEWVSSLEFEREKNSGIAAEKALNLPDKLDVDLCEDILREFYEEHKDDIK